MNINSSSNTYSSLSSSSKGLSGLASGMDTEEMVAKMLEGQTKKIQKQKANKQVAQWKQDIYRDTITRINTFNKKFFDITSPTSLVSNAFFNQMKSTTASSNFRITGSSSDAISGEMRLKIDALASQTTVEGANLDVSNPLSGKFSPDALDATVTFDIRTQKENNGTPIVDADGKPVYETTGSLTLSNANIEKLMKGEDVTIETDNKDPAKPKDVTHFSVKDGKLTINSDLILKVQDTKPGVADSTTQLGLDILGISAGLEGNKFEGVMDKNASTSINVTLDGNTKKIKLSKDETKTSLQEKLDFALGKDAIKVEGNEDLSSFKFTTQTGRKISVSGSAAGLSAIGMKDGQSNSIGVGDTLEHAFGLTGDENGMMNIEINGVKFEFSKTDTISTVQSKIKNSDADVELKYNDFDNNYSFVRKSSGKGFDITLKDDTTSANGAVDSNSALLGKLLGTTGGAPLVTDANGKPTSSEITYKDGTNAKFELNGKATERSSNTFTVAGVSVELLSVTKGADAEAITTTRNTDSIYDGIKSFVDEYNLLIKDLTKVVEADLEYKDYPPLTDEQRKDMSQGEIDAWEKKAQVGLLTGDSNINSFLSQLRLSIYQKPDVAKFSMFDIGIETTDKIEKRGELKIDEAKLKEMINQDPQSISDLFTFQKTKEITTVDSNGKDVKTTVPDGVQGIAIAFKNIIKATANTSSGSPGVLTQIAGYENTASDKKNMLYDQMKLANDRITMLTRQYEQQKKRYWGQFTSMERVVSNLNTQSSWLAQQTSY